MLFLLSRAKKRRAILHREIRAFRKTLKRRKEDEERDKYFLYVDDIIPCAKDIVCTI